MILWAMEEGYYFSFYSLLLNFFNHVCALFFYRFFKETGLKRENEKERHKNWKLNPIEI